MRLFSYRALLQPGDREGVVIVTFPDVPEAITEGEGEADALRQAHDALATALLTYPMRGLPLPVARTKTGCVVTIGAGDAAKLAVLEAFAASGMTKTELANRLGVAENEARRILDPMHRTKLARLEQALAVLGRRLVVGVETLTAAA